MKLNPVTLGFFGEYHHLEESFLRDYLKNSLKHIRIGLILGCLFFALFGVLDAILIPTKKHLLWLIRYGIVCPATISVLFLSYLSIFQRWLQPVLSALIVISGGGIVAMIMIAPPPISYSYYAGLILVFMFGYSFLRVRFMWATLAGWLVVILYEIAALSHNTPMAVLINNNFFFVAANIIGMLACYSIEFYTRRAYYLNWLLIKEKEKVSLANQELEKRVKKKTSQLERINEELLLEIRDRKQSEEINKTLFAISNTVNTTSNLDDLYKQIHNILGKILDVTNFFIAIVDEKERTLCFPYYVDTIDDDFATISNFDPEKSLTGFVVSNRKPLLLKREKLQELRNGNGVWGPVPLIWMGIPLIVKKEIIGVMVLQSYTDPFIYTERDLELLISISDQMAVAVDRKRTEDELRKSEEKFRNAFKTSPYAITLTDLSNGAYLDINDAFTKVLGYPPQEVIGKSYMDLDIWNDTKDRDLLVSKLKNDGIVENFHTDFKGKDGQIINGLISAHTLDMGNKKYLFSATQDMTKFKKNEQERLDLERKLQQAQKMEAIGTLAGGIAHDFNNILSSIMGFSQLAAYDINSPVKIKSYIAQIDKGTRRAAELVGQILTFSRQTEYQKNPLRIHAVLNEALKLLRSSIPSTIDIKKNIDSKAAVLADPTQIHQLIINLCTNAYHAIGEDKGWITISLLNKKMEVENHFSIPPGDYLELEVSDTGIGMDETMIEKIFDPYFTTKEIGRGTGFGLALVKAIVKEHEGFIAVISKPGQGTSFFVYLPVFKGSVKEKISLPQKESKSFNGNERIMIVDDEASIRNICKQILKRHGYNVDVFKNGLEAFAEFEKDPHRYDLVITDMTMPEMAGDKLAMEIFKKNPDLPVILCTGLGKTISKHKTSLIGIRKVLDKPLSMNVLVKTVRHLLDEQE